VRLSETIQRIDETAGLLRNVDGAVTLANLSKRCLMLCYGKTKVSLCYAKCHASCKTRATPSRAGAAAEIAAFKFAPVVSCEVARSFSRYKAILRDNRHRILFANIRKDRILHCNANNNDDR